MKWPNVFYAVSVFVTCIWGAYHIGKAESDYYWQTYNPHNAQIIYNPPPPPAPYSNELVGIGCGKDVGICVNEELGTVEYGQGWTIQNILVEADKHTIRGACPSDFDSQPVKKESGK